MRILTKLRTRQKIFEKEKCFQLKEEKTPVLSVFFLQSHIAELDMKP